MATMSPDWNTIQNLQQKTTEGELYLLKFLDENLDESYEVYFQPFLNGDRPDIVVMRQGSGVLIIEVKDWSLQNYVNRCGKWFVKKDGQEHLVLSPYKQVKKYKENLYNLHIPTLLENKIRNPNFFSVVNCALYFHNSNKLEFNEFNKEESPSNTKWIRGLTPDQLKRNGYFQRFLYETYLSRQSILFLEDLYNSFKRFFQPPTHTIEEVIEITYSKEQKQLIESKAGDKKIRGVAGSGKTMVLAKRAVNSHLRTREKVLILTYNITLKNYIHDLLSKVRENFAWEHFKINNYHNFINHFLNNEGISKEELFKSVLRQDSKLIKFANNNNFDNLQEQIVEDLGKEDLSEIWEKAVYSNLNFFSKHEISVSDKYDSIFIDEVQDYHYEWLEIIKKCFLNSGGEYVLFGDEKQNIYERQLETDKKVKTNISGRWDESLKKSFRLHKNIASIAADFQKEFLNKYEFDSIEIVEQKSLFNENILKIEYHEIRNEPAVIANFINSYIETNGISPNDVAVLGTAVSFLRNIDFEFRQVSRERTSTTFETQEMFELLFRKDYNSISKEDEEIKLNKNFLDGNLQIALRKVLSKIDFIENPEIYTEVPDEVGLNNDYRVDNLVEKITPRINMEIENIRKNKKVHFWMNSGVVKMSTIHSFKGWEVPTLFLLLDNMNDRFPKHELIYTAITRCRFNLVVLSIGSQTYSDFFKRKCNIFQPINGVD
ncbi:MAG: AAA family ATPase [Ignavibacteria bacterium]|nr:AAA family ATPase [Ignavibacteria bacterium]